MPVDPEIAFSQGDLMRRLRQLEARVRELDAGRRLENASVGAGGIRVTGSGGITLTEGGGILVDDGGDVGIDGGTLAVRAPNGQVTYYVGPDSQGRQVFSLRTDQGTLVFRTFYLTGTDSLVWALYDLTGRLIMSADGLTGVGMAEPWISVPGEAKCFPDSFLDSAGTDNTLPASSLDSEETVWEGRIGKVSHPKIQVDWVGGRVSGTSAVPTYAFVVGGDELDTWSHTNYQAQLQGPYDITDKIGDTNVTVQVRAQATGTGTDRVAVQMNGVWMRQS